MLSSSMRTARLARGSPMARRFLSTSEASGIKVSSVEDLRPVSELSLVVKAGSKYEPAATRGVAHILEKFAYKNTTARSALRLVRESELLGGQLASTLTREHLVLTTRFLREDLPYFVEALGDVAGKTIYNQYELDEDVIPLAKLEYQTAHADNAYTAIEAAHNVAFHNGLGNALLAGPYKAVSLEAVKNYAREAYTKANVQLVGRGVSHEDLTQLVGSKFAHLPAGSALEAPAASFHAGEARIGAHGTSAAVLSFAAPASEAASLTVLAQHLGTKNHSIKWSLGGSTPLGVASRKTGATIAAGTSAYSDGVLFYITVEGSATEVSAGLAEAVASLKADVSAEQAARAVAKAKFASAETVESSPVAAVATAAQDFASVSASSLKKAAASAATKDKAAFAVVGDVTQLPYLDELL